MALIIVPLVYLLAVVGEYLAWGLHSCTSLPTNTLMIGSKFIFTVFPDGFSFLALISLFLIALSCVSG